jgi:hypothetical protein
MTFNANGWWLRSSRAVVLWMAVAALAACSSSAISQQNLATSFSGPVRGLIVAQTGSPMSDALRPMLLGKGYVVEFREPLESENELADPATRSRLQGRGVDVAVFVRDSGRNAQGNPEGATAVLADVRSGEVVTVLTWENGQGFGLTNSVSNSAMSKTTTEAAGEIAERIHGVLKGVGGGS